MFNADTTLLDIALNCVVDPVYFIPDPDPKIFYSGSKLFFLSRWLPDPEKVRPGSKGLKRTGSGSAALAFNNKICQFE
jgi:hypothetical protein